MEVEGEEEGGMMTRIFVGGLGGSVTAEDLEKTFSSLGVIKSVEIVRTNGRSFAYMDFQPSSPKSLAKLFSMYNGCVWKGGRLKLEKAREHYLVRLKREWTEDAELASTAERASNALNDDSVAEKKKEVSEKLKSLSEEKLQVNIFFPGLRKVKALPYRGSGKHKYSFQRIQVPSMPIHFCDCEEHCGPLETAKAKHVHALETQTDATTEEELNMMRSVMNKILKRENNLGTENDGMKMATKGDSNQPNDDVLLGEIEAGEEPDGDDLVINMVSGGNERFNQEMEAISADMESKFSKHGRSDDGPVTNKLNAQKRKDIKLFNSSNPTSNKKARLPLEEENDQDKFTQTKPQKNSSSKAVAEESKNAAGGQPAEQKESIQQSTKGLSWIQKSSWKKMVGDTKTNFRISHILPDTATKENLPESTGLHTENFTDSKQQNIKQTRTKSTRDRLRDLELGKEGSLQDNFSTASGSTVAPSNKTSIDSEYPREADENASIHESAGKEGSPQDNVSTAGGSTRIPFNTTSQDSEGPIEVEQKSSIYQLLGKEGTLQDEVGITGDLITAPSNTTPKDSDGPNDSKLTDEAASIKQSTAGVSWVQKSSWRELVGETNLSSFSISHILPGVVKSTTGKVADPKSSGTGNSSAGKQKNLANSSGIEKDGTSQDKVNAPSGSKRTPSEVEDEILASMKVEFNVLGKNSKNENDDNKACSKPTESKSHGDANKKPTKEAAIGEVCTFMRSAQSEKEWMKAKTALSGSLKKKSIEK